jgi:hypothetical protein
MPTNSNDKSRSPNGGSAGKKPKQERISTTAEPKGRPTSPNVIIGRRGSIRGTRLG